jgi:Tfp pilus assembly protein PilF
MEICQILVDVHPEDAKAHTVYADYLYRDKKLKEARDEYALAIKTEKGKFSIWNQLMIIESEIRDYTSLETHSKEAMDLFPSQPLPLYFNGAAKMQLKKYKEAAEAFQEAREYVIDNVPLLTQVSASLGEAYHHLKEDEKSDKAFDEAVKLDPDNTTILNNYAYYLSLRKTKLDKAEKFAARANELNKNSPSYMDTYGWILYQQGKLSEAKVWLEKAIKGGGDKNSVILEHYGDICYKLNENDKAMEWWKKAKTYSKGNEGLDQKILSGKLIE